MHPIGKAAELSGVKVTTIRYYEEVGLMPEPERRASGRRSYDHAAIDRLRFIRHARDLGFPVESIRSLIDLQQTPGRDCSQVDALASRHLDDVRARIARLRELEAELERITHSCRGGTVEACEIMACLGDHSLCDSDRH